MKCPSCQQEDWIEGDLIEHNGSKTAFKPAQSKMFVFRYPPVRASVCRMCGHLHLAVDAVEVRSILKEE